MLLVINIAAYVNVILLYIFSHDFLIKHMPLH